ncbi:MAG: membrane protein insertase YidC [Anaerolineae bacterium]|nr:membrane protein insertase YidC [Anaerolineae bacterium]
MWDLMIQGFVLALIWLYKVLGSSEWSLALSIAVMTIAVRLLTIPLTLPSQRSMKKNSLKMQTLQPELDKLKKKFRNDPQKLQQAQLQLYQEHGINPLSSMTGCLPMLIQLPIIWAFYQSISRALANKPGEMVVLSKYLYAVPRFMPLVPLPSKFLWFDMGRPDMLVLPILVAATTWLQQKLTTANTPQATDPQAAQMSQSMMITMPLMFGFFAMQMPAGLSVYFIVSNIVGLGVQWLTNRLIKDDEPVVSRPRSQAQPPIRTTEKQDKTDQSTRRKRGYKRKS